ncbi:MAG: PKD domain-containing protein [Bacteroidales bacterium]|nr:PKD domain-containing protein [Bacteroidales bacterium]
MITDIRGCVDTAFQQVCVPSELTATFSYTQSCFGEPMQFTPAVANPAAPADSLISFQWNFGDPQSGAQNLSTLKTPGHTFTAPGFYTINFSTTDQFGCQADDYQSVQVHALPVALFDYTRAAATQPSPLPAKASIPQVLLLPCTGTLGTGHWIPSMLPQQVPRINTPQPEPM